MDQIQKQFLTLDIIALQNDNSLVMNNIATVTSKRQVTIPTKIFKEANLKQGTKLSFTVQKDGSILIKNPIDAINRLAGSVKVPPHLRGKDLNEVRREAIKIHFIKKHEEFLKSN